MLKRVNIMRSALFAGAFLLLFGVVSAGYANEYRNVSRESRAPKSYVWDNAIVPYTFDSNFNNARDQQDWMTATRYIEARTCVRFRQKQGGDSYWLIVVKEGCCWSWVGRLTGQKDKGQKISFGGGHIQPFYLHELGHALAYPHEQDRPDRDDYIYWDSNKDKDKCQGGFGGKYENGDLKELRFDYVSLMADWTECYWPRENIAPRNIPMGPGGSDQRTFSVVDIERLNSLYDCRGCYGYRFMFPQYMNSQHRRIEAGYELDGNKFYICRVYHEGHLLVGKTKQEDQASCWAAFEGGEGRYRERFEVLADPYQSGFRWQRRSDDFSIPRNAIKGGRTKDRETVYIARCLVTAGDRRTLIPGFVREGNGREARVPFGGGARVCQDFEYLVCG